MSSPAAALQRKLVNIAKPESSKYSVVKQTGSTIEIAEPSLTSGKLVYFQHCEDCNFNMTTKCNKVILENCNNCRLTVSEKIITSTMEIIGCKGLTIIANIPIHTLSVDLSVDVELNFSADTNFQSVILSLSDRVMINVPPLESLVVNAGNLPSAPTHDHGGRPTAPQHIVQVVDGKLHCESVVREGSGYATTARQKAMHDAKVERDLAILRNALQSPGNTNQNEGSEGGNN